MSLFEGPREFLESAAKHPVRTLLLVILLGAGIFFAGTLNQAGSDFATWILAPAPKEPAPSGDAPPGSPSPSPAPALPPGGPGSDPLKVPSPAPSPVAGPSGKQPAAGKPRGNDAGGTRASATDEPAEIFAQCEPRSAPSVMPADGLHRRLAPSEKGSGRGFVEDRQAPGTRILRKASILAKRCELTNYSDKPLFNISIHLKVTFLESLPGESGTSRRAGAVTTERAWLLDIAKLDASRSEPFAFYIENETPDRWFTIAFPESASADGIASVKIRQAARHLESPFPPLE